MKQMGDRSWCPCPPKRSRASGSCAAATPQKSPPCSRSAGRSIPAQANSATAAVDEYAEPVLHNGHLEVNCGGRRTVSSTCADTIGVLRIRAVPVFGIRLGIRPRGSFGSIVTAMAVTDGGEGRNRTGNGVGSPNHPSNHNLRNLRPIA